MLIRAPDEIRSSEITDEPLTLRRREFLGTALAAGAALLPGCGRADQEPARAAHPGRAAGPFDSDEELTRFEDATGYNNFYEFGTDKRDPSRYAHSLRTDPWSVSMEGELGKPGAVALEDILAAHPREERIYRLRCVEAWSMVIPWLGFPLGDLLKRHEPTSRARYVEFRTLHDPEQMRGQRTDILPWPYREGLRMDEAMHPLTLLAVGMYGRELPNQNGAPLRLVLPWKYGFKSIKSIVGIRLSESQPATTWNLSAPDEYGFYANVNPSVDHPRWSQKKERRIGEFRKRPTLPFNGYGEQVAHLYRGMNLRENF